MKKSSRKAALKWYPLELNQRPTDFQSVALPTELGYRFIFCACKDTKKMNDTSIFQKKYPH